MAQPLRLYLALPEAPSAHVRQLTTDLYSGGPNAPIWPSRTPAHRVHTRRDTHIHTHVLFCFQEMVFINLKLSQYL